MKTLRGKLFVILFIDYILNFVEYILLNIKIASKILQNHINKFQTSVLSKMQRYVLNTSADRKICKFMDVLGCDYLVKCSCPTKNNNHTRVTAFRSIALSYTRFGHKVKE
jgi:hypothetical protein